MCCQGVLRAVLPSRNMPARARKRRSDKDNKGHGMRRSLLGLAGCGILALAAAFPASAQDVDRIAGKVTPGGGFKPPEGVRIVNPGALVFASFDRNFDGHITADEIQAGAEAVFAIADKNQDGSITGFEQSDWAAIMGSGGDVLANTMTFDIDLDRAVTKEEFVTGMKRLASQIQPSGDLTFNDLIQPLDRLKEQANNDGGPGFGRITPRGSPPGGNRNQ
jgi:hypothetical protein